MRFILALASLAISFSAGAADQPMRFPEKAQIMAELKSANIGCRQFDMILDDYAYRLFVVQSKDAAFFEGTGEAEAVSIAYKAEEAQKKKVDESGGDLVKVAGSPSAMARYTEYWRSTCEGLKRNPFTAKFFTSRANQKLPPPSYVPDEYAARMCYKDYCPCIGQQSSLDKMLCDRLEEGLKVDVGSMISGRALRAAKEEIDRSGF